MFQIVSRNLFKFIYEYSTIGGLDCYQHATNLYETCALYCSAPYDLMGLLVQTMSE